MFNRRMLTIALLGFSSGLPLALTGSTLQAWYTVSGASIVAIGMLSLVGQPYALKFLWAPFLDRFIPPALGRRRGWIAIAQLTLVVALVIMALNNPNSHPTFLMVLALVVAFLSATQDIAIDAYRTDLLMPREWGLGAALNSGGYRIAMLVSGGMAMVLADHIGWQLTYFLMAGLVGLNVVVTYFAPPLVGETVRCPMNLRQAVIEPFREFLSRDAAWGLLLFMVLYKLADAFVLVLGTAFLLRGIGFSLTDVGAIYKVVGLCAVLLGSFAGGVWMVRLSLYRALFMFGVLQGLSVIPFIALAIVGKSYNLMVLAIFVEKFCNGLLGVAFIAFLMSLCDKRYTATQFALFSSLAVSGRAEQTITKLFDKDCEDHKVITFANDSECDKWDDG